MPEQAFEAKLSRVGRNPWIMGVAGLPFLGTLALLIAGIFNPHYFFGVPHTIVLGGVATLYAWRKNFSPVMQPVDTRADWTGVRLGGALVARSKIRAGFIKPTAGAPRVLLQRTFGPSIELEVSRGEDGRALLMALGLDVSQTVANFRTPSRVLTARWFAPLLLGGFAGIVALSMALRGPAAFVGFFLAVAWMMCFVALTAIPSRLRVGADGVDIRWLHTRRFLAHGDIVGVVRFEKGWGNSKLEGLRVTLRSGEEVQIPIRRGQFDDDQLAIIGERILEGKEALERGDIAVDAALLERGDRPLRDWVASLRAIGTEANATLRTAPVPRDRLMHIVEDPKQAPAARAAAAVALGGALDAEGRVRLRLAAEATAAPKLRVAIERVANGEKDAEIEEALAEIDGEGTRRGVA
jgi:hypothetical protein